MLKTKVTGVFIPKSLAINDEIKSPVVMLIDGSGKSFGSVSIDQALLLAWEEGVDLVEVGPNANPPVARILNYGKYQYEQAKAESKSRAKGPELKELRVTLNIGKHDLEVKTNQADKWLEEGNRVRITVTLFGREMLYPDQARALIDKIREMLNANYESEVTTMGKRFSALVGRKKQR